jgi:hypothetical protein
VCAEVSYFVRALDVSNNISNSPTKFFTVPGTCGPIGDLNGDGRVDGADLATLLNSWGSGGPADLNGDSIVDASDMAILLNNFG